MTRTRLAIIVAICAAMVVILIIGAVSSSSNNNGKNESTSDERVELASDEDIASSVSSENISGVLSDNSDAQNSDGSNMSDSDQNSEVGNGTEQSQDVLNFIDMLKRYPFVTSDGKSYLLFSDNEAVWEIRGSTKNEVNYSISGVSVETISGDDGITFDRYKATITINNRSYNMTSDTTEDGSLGNLVCSGFSGNSSWVVKTSQDDITVGDLVEDANLLIDGKNEDAKSCIIDYCRSYLPTVNQVVPFETATIDFADNAVELYYSVSPIGNNPLIVTYDKNSCTFSATRN